MSHISYLKNASTEVVAQVCRQYGAIGFIGTGLTEFEKLEVLSAAVEDLDRQCTDLSSFFTTTLRSDDSYERIVYDIEDSNPVLGFVYLRKTIHYKQFHPDIERRAPKIERGPFLSRKKAQVIVGVMNEE